MPSHIVIAKIIFVMIGTHTTGYETGVGAYYHKCPGQLQRVCIDRMTHGWVPPGVVLDCSWPCLIAGIEQDTLGEWWLVDVPGASMHV